MSPGGTTGTVIGDEGTTLLRTSGGLTVKRMSGGSPGRSGNLLSTVTQVAHNSMQEMSLSNRKLFTEDGQEIIAPETEMVTIQGKSVHGTHEVVTKQQDKCSEQLVCLFPFILCFYVFQCCYQDLYFISFSALGPDGVVYQVQGQLEDGAQTLLVQGEDGEQRCVYVTTNHEGEDGSTVLTLDSAYADAVAQLDSNQVRNGIVLLKI